MLWIPWHQEIPGNEEQTDWPRKGLLKSHLTSFAVPFSVGKKLIEKHLELRHQVRSTACTGFWQSKMLMRYPLPSRTNKFLAMCKVRLRAAVRLLKGHKSLRAHLYKLGHTEERECWLCIHEKEDSVHSMCDCPVFACKRYRGRMFLKPKDLEKVRVSSLLSLLANTGLGLVS